MKYLNELKLNDKGIIKKLEAEGGLKKKLLEMGIIPNSPFEVTKIAPLGDPIDIKIKGYHLSLRKVEAQNILVEVND